jgi:hypothetical protein
VVFGIGQNSPGPADNTCGLWPLQSIGLGPKRKASPCVLKDKSGVPSRKFNKQLFDQLGTNAKPKRKENMHDMISWALKR